VASFRPPIDGGAVLITGASPGIGLELARALASRVGALVTVTRRADRE
jgi:short-subunit dehydrogenase